MEKDNVFCSSKFHLDTGDVLHISIKDLVGTQPTIVLYNDIGLQEDIYPPPIVYSTINYGYLYNWFAANHVSNIAPAGWHLPTKTEFETLVAYAGGDAVAGGKLKETGITHWLTPNTGATNEYGLNTRGGGMRISSSGNFCFFQTHSYCWSSSIAAPTTTYVLIVYHIISGISIAHTYRGYGLSIRLIKDNSVDTGYMTGNDGKIYHSVKIGNQVWLADNLAETKYRNGDSIAYVTTNPAWVFAYNNSLQAMCAYENNLSNV